MAMLAEPRQRKRYNLTPRGKALYEDDSRFGTKMLEKMGWSKGKGLGAKEDGGQDFVRVRMRNTNEGLGYEDRDDHWTQHEQDFNGLLKTLNGDSVEKENDTKNKESASDEETPRVGFGFAPEPKKPKVEKLKDKISGISLEEKSKLSKARVHYRKFTKGKDLAQYSEKDLANIFGKKVVETEEADGIYSTLTAIAKKEELKEEEQTVNSDEKEVKSNFGGVQTISTGLSVSDYFKQKMEALKNKQKLNNSIPHSEQSDVTLIEKVQEEQSEEKKKKKRKRDRDAVVVESQIDLNESKYPDMKKEELKLKDKSSEIVVLGNDIKESVNSKSDKKKNKKRVLETLELSTQEDNLLDIEVPKKKKKKCKESVEVQVVNNAEVIQEYEKVENQAVEETKKKKKPKKSKIEQCQELDVAVNVDDEAPSQQILPKTKKDKSLKEEVPASLPDRPADNSVVKKNKKSKNKEKLEEDTQQMNDSINDDSVTTQSSKKSKKAKKLKNATQASTTKQSEDKQSQSKKDVSDEIQTMTLDELIAKYNSYNVYTISSFCAEKFRNVELDSFKGSTIAHIPGYSHTADLQLKVVNEPKDEARITQLWNCSLNKYHHLNPKVIFNKYRENMFKAYKSKKKSNKKQKLPAFNIKSLKRKNVFQPI